MMKNLQINKLVQRLYYEVQLYCDIALCDPEWTGNIII